MGILEKSFGPARTAHLQGRPRRSQEAAELEAVLHRRADAWHGDDRVQLRAVPHSGHPAAAAEHGHLANTVDKDPNVITGTTVDPKTGKLTAGGKVPAIIAFIQAVSFSTNTDWQSYEPEQMFTHFSQTVPTLIHFFFSSAVGIAVAAALVRGVARKQTNDIGNFWVDLTRITLYLFLPICLVFATARCLAGNSDEFQAVHAGHDASINPAQRPTTQPTSRRSCRVRWRRTARPKVLGLNGPGFTGADCAHPFENPDAAFRIPATDAVLLRSSPACPTTTAA